MPYTMNEQEIELWCDSCDDCRCGVDGEWFEFVGKCAGPGYPVWPEDKPKPDSWPLGQP